MQTKQNDITLTFYKTISSENVSLPFADMGIKAGFPSPAQDYISDSIDLNKELIRHRETTFMARVVGDSLKDAGIGNGDLVVIDKSIEAKHGDYVVAYIDGEFTLKQFQIDSVQKCGWLMPANPAYQPIKITENNDFSIWGIITFCIKQFYHF